MARHSWTVIILSALLAGGCADSGARERSGAARLHRTNAESALQAGDYVRAAIAAELAAAYDPFDPQLRDLVIRVRLTAIATSPDSVQLDRPAEAEYHAEAFAARDPKNAHVYKTARGYIALARRDEKAAEGFFREAIAAKAGWASSQIALGTLLLRQGRLDDAAPLLEGAVKSEPKNAAALAGLGRLLLGKGELARATELLRQAVEHRDAAAVRLDLAKALWSAQRAQEAVAEARRAVELEPSNGEAHRQLGEMLLALDQIDPAQAELTAASKLGAEPLATFGLGLVLRRKGEPAQAARLFEAVWNTDSRIAVAAYQAGLAHEEAGDAAAAVASFGRFIQAAGRDPAERERAADAVERMQRLASRKR